MKMNNSVELKTEKYGLSMTWHRSK